MKGIKRFRQAIKNQRDTGEGEFRLTYHDAEEIAAEIDGEHGWAAGVPAPRDSDGEVVPLTTRLMYMNNGEIIRVGSICFNGHSWYVFNLDNLKPCWLNELHHTEHDSWEKLEEDAKLAPRAYLEKRGMNPEKTERVASMMADLVSRAKALAERGAKEASRG